MDALGAALKIDEGSAQAHYLMGLCLDALKKPEQAKVSLHRAVELSPALLDAREKLADLHRQTDHADDEIIQLEGLRTLDPGSPSRHVSLGLALAEAGQLDRSVAILAATAERFPTDSYTFVALGRVWFEAAQTRDDPVLLQKAVEALERGVSGDASSEALMLLGKALLQYGKPERATTVLLEATTKKPDEGRGLGLSVSANIIKRYGGTIEVESTPAQGTVFHIFLPEYPLHLDEQDVPARGLIKADKEHAHERENTDY